MSRRRKIQYVLLGATLVFIWGNSCVPIAGSAAESGRVTALLQTLLGPLVGAENITDHLVRKAAHFTEYAALGFQLLLLRRDRSWKGAARAVELGFLAAFLDESIQMFSGRGAQISDVWIDVFGAAFGTAVALLLVLLLRRGRRARV